MHHVNVDTRDSIDTAELCELALHDYPNFLAQIKKYIQEVPADEQESFMKRLEYIQKDNRLILSFLKDLQRAVDETRAKVKQAITDAVEEALEEALRETQMLTKALSEGERLVREGYEPEFPLGENEVADMVYEEEADAIRRYKEQANDLTEDAPEQYRSEILQDLKMIEGRGYLKSTETLKEYLLSTCQDIAKSASTMLALEIVKGYIDPKYREAITRRMQEVLERRFGWQLVSMYFLMHALGVPRNLNALVEKHVNAEMINDCKWVHRVLTSGKIEPTIKSARGIGKDGGEKEKIRVQVRGLGITDEQAKQVTVDLFGATEVKGDDGRTWLEIEINGPVSKIKDVLQQLREADVIVENFEVL